MGKLLSRGILGIALLCAGVLAQAAGMEQVCSKIAKARGPAAYLVDKSGALVTGPISFGRYAVSADHVSDYEIASTPYRLLVFPGRITASSQECNMCVHLTKVAQACRNTSTYEVGVGLTFPKPGGTRPYKEEAPLILEFDESGAVYPPSVKFNFEEKIVGELVESAKK